MRARGVTPLSHLWVRDVEAGYAHGTAVAADTHHRDDETETYAEYLDRARREQEDRA